MPQVVHLITALILASRDLNLRSLKVGLDEIRSAQE